MKQIKVEQLPIEVLDKIKVLGNVFDELDKKKENYERMVCELINILKDKYNLTNENWNEDIAPLLRKYF